MKRSHSSDNDDKKRGRITSDNSTSTRGTDTHIKKVRKDGTHLKHHLRRGANSAVEYMKTEWTSDELDLNKHLKPLTDFVDDNHKFIEEVFSIFSIQELKSLTPDILKDLSVNQLKDLCLEELKSISAEKIKFICEGNKPEDFEKLKAEEINTLKNDNERSIDIQLSVDDNEYSDFLGAENIESKVSTKDAEIQANESSLESSSDEELVSDDNKEGWMNIFAKTQMEILELEMRARAIRTLLKAQEQNQNQQQPQDKSQQKDVPKQTQLEDQSKQISPTIENLIQSKQISPTIENLIQSKQNESEFNVLEHIIDNRLERTISTDDSELNETNLEEENSSDNEEERVETKDDMNVNQSSDRSVIVSDNENTDNTNDSNYSDIDDDQNSKQSKEDFISGSEESSNV